MFYSAIVENLSAVSIGPSLIVGGVGSARSLSGPISSAFSFFWTFSRTFISAKEGQDIDFPAKSVDKKAVIFPFIFHSKIGRA